MLIQQHNMSRLVLLPRIIHREGVRAYHLICFSARYSAASFVR